MPSAVLAELPDRQNLRKCVQRERLRDLPSNPQDIEDLREIPDKYRKTITGETFLEYDAYEEYNLSCVRILIFCTKERMKIFNKDKI